MAAHLYRVTSVPSGCSDYQIDDEVELEVPEPPPATMTIGEGECEGVVVHLIS